MKNIRSFEIVEFVKERRRCSMEQLMERFKVSCATIHRDVSALVAAGELCRIRGGVSVFEGSEVGRGDNFFRERLVSERSAKQEIAEQALNEVHDGDILFLDSSTTVYCLAEKLRTSSFGNLTILTNSVLIQREFALFPPHYSLIGLGGNYDLQLNAFLGQSTFREMSRIKVNTAFISALGISREGITSRHENHALFLRYVMERAERTILLLSSGKFTRSGLFPIAPLEKLDSVISDRPLPFELERLLQKN